MKTVPLFTVGLLAVLGLSAGWLSGCVQSSGVTSASGGSPGSGGATGRGGATAASSAGGSNTGGTSGSGGSVATGGSKGSGGASGGQVGTGGRLVDAAVKDSATESATGGTPASGGKSGAGGIGGQGGGASDGGPRADGSTRADGSRGTGGTSGTGGQTGTGGNITIGNVTTTCPGAVPAGVTSSWCSCEQWGQWKNGDLTYYNNIWGSGAGAQCTWATTTGAWGVAANHPSSSGIKSYPNVSLSPGKAISAINAYSSSFDVNVPSGGAYETAYDLWVKGSSASRIEIMLWMNSAGAVGPIASGYDSSGKPIADKANVNVGGHTWNVYFGTNGSNDVVSFVRTSNTKTGTVDIKAILHWIIANATKYAVFTTSWTLDQVQFGYEITSDGGAQGFVTNSFSVTSS